jgi:hypothetical protein
VPGLVLAGLGAVALVVGLAWRHAGAPARSHRRGADSLPSRPGRRPAVGGGPAVGWGPAVGGGRTRRERDSPPDPTRPLPVVPRAGPAALTEPLSVTRPVAPRQELARDQRATTRPVQPTRPIWPGPDPPSGGFARVPAEPPPQGSRWVEGVGYVDPDPDPDPELRAGPDLRADPGPRGDPASEPDPDLRADPRPRAGPRREDTASGPAGRP